MASTSLSIHGARKVTLKTEVVTSSVDNEKYAFMRIRFDDGSGSEVTEISSFRCNGITIEDADELEVFFVKDAKGKTRLEIGLSDSALGVGDVERTDAKVLYGPFEMQEQEI
tara:strand:+ start:397 stop:732 length:336 start_codon:yes stop_codon:yes gene_type:complete